MGKAVTLCAQHDGELRLGGKSAVVNAYGAVAQSHGSSLEAKTVQLSNAVFRPVGRAGADLRPGHLKHGAHAHTHGTAAQRVAAGRSNEHGIHVQCSGAAEDRSHIGGVHNALQNGHPAGIAADLFHAARQRAAEGAQHAAGQLEAGQAGKGLAVGCVHRGIPATGQDILIILGRNQSIIEDHFDRSPELEEKLAKPGKEKALEECLGIANMANILFVRQKQTLGLGHAVNTAKAFTGDDPFVVIYGDDVIWGEDPVCAQLIRAYEEFGRPAAGVSAVPWEDVSRYCSLKTTPIHDNYFFVDDMIEKPKKGQEFSNYSILGRVLLTPEIYEILAHTKPGAGGEIQLTDAMAEYARTRGGMTAVEFTGKHYDMGNKLKVVEAQVELALQHPEIGEEFRAYLKEFCKTL